MRESELPPPRHEASDAGLRLAWIGVPAVIGGVLLFAWLVLKLYPGGTADRTLDPPLARFPAPALQSDLVGDYNRLRESQLRQLNSAGWLDPQHRFAHVPIDEAMRQLARDGIADWPAAGTGDSHVP